MSCNRCKGTSTDPFNFLLSCSECEKKWHHRCHIPPLSDPELTALIRATNENDIDNGLSSWIGRCCRRKRVQVQANPEKAVSRPVEVAKPQVHSPSPAPAVSPIAASIRQISQKPGSSSGSAHRHDQTTSLDGVAAPLIRDGGHATKDLGLPDPQTPTESQMTTFVRPTVQRSMTVSPDIVEVQPERSRTMPLPSASGNVSSASVADLHPARLRDNSMPLARTPPSQPTDPAHVQAHSRSSKHTSASGSVEPAQANSDPMDIDIDLLDLRELTLNQASSSHRKTAASRTHSPLQLPPSSEEEEDEIEELDGPPSAPPLQQQPAPPEPRLLPVLAAEDPRMLAALERHEMRQAARPRQGMHKTPAVRRAGVKRGGFVLVAERKEVATPCREPRGVFAAYFARS